MPTIHITITDTPTAEDDSKVTIKCESDEPIKPENLSPAQRLAAFMLESPSIMQQMQEVEADEDEDAGAPPDNPSLN